MKKICITVFFLTVFSLTALTVDFSGYSWGVFGSNKAGARAPGPNRFSPDSVFVDEENHLHLSVIKRDGYWWASEVNVKKILGYGRYTLFMGSSLQNLDFNTVFGFFTWDVRQGGDTHREWDLEISRWGSSSEKKNVWYTVQPYDTPGHQDSFSFADPAGDSVHEILWKENYLQFRSYLTLSDFRSGKIFRQWEFHGDAVPLANKERLRMNLWQFRGKEPDSGVKQEVIIKEFTFEPLL